MKLIIRNLASNIEIKPLNHTRNFPSNLYFEYISDFKSLSLEEQEYLWHRIFVLYRSSFTSSHYEKVKYNFSKVPNKQIKLFILKEKRFGTDIGMNLLFCNEFYYKENDTSIENKYISSYYAISLLHHYRGGNIGKALVDVGEFILRSEFPNCNRISYNRSVNSFHYEYMNELSPLVYPGPNKMPNDEIEFFLRKIMNEINAKGISEEKPFVEEFPVYINSLEYERYRNEKRGINKARDYYYEQTGLLPGRLLLNLAVFNLIEGNTLNIKPGSYEKIPKIDIEIVEYKPKFASRL